MNNKFNGKQLHTKKILNGEIVSHYHTFINNKIHNILKLISSQLP